MGQVVVIGSSNTDLVYAVEHLPRPGETVHSTSFDVFAGGKGANQAVASARAGAQVSFAGAVGADTYGRDRLNDLVNAGVDISNVRVVDDAVSGIAMIFVDREGENQIVVSPGANDRFFPDDAASIVAVVVPDVLLATLESPMESIVASIQACGSQTTRIVNAAPYRRQVVDLRDQVDILVCNEIEAARLVSRTVRPSDAPDAARQIQDLGFRCVVITLGSSGAFVTSDCVNRMVAAPTVTPVDTTGAGDAFCGALSAWVSDGADIISAVQAGVAAGSCAVTVPGAQPSMPTKQRIVQLIASMTATSPDSPKSG